MFDQKETMRKTFFYGRRQIVPKKSGNSNITQFIRLRWTVSWLIWGSLGDPSGDPLGCDTTGDPLGELIGDQSGDLSGHDLGVGQTKCVC